MHICLVHPRHYSSLSDMKAALDLIKEDGGKVLHIAPILGGFVVEATANCKLHLDLPPWH